MNARRARRRAGSAAAPGYQILRRPKLPEHVRSYVGAALAENGAARRELTPESLMDCPSCGVAMGANCELIASAFAHAATSPSCEPLLSAMLDAEPRSATPVRFDLTVSDIL